MSEANGYQVFQLYYMMILCLIEVFDITFLFKASKLYSYAHSLK